MELLELEEWLQTAAVPTVLALQPSTARIDESLPESGASEIVRSWAQVRIGVQERVLTSLQFSALEFIYRYRRSLQVAEPQAKLLALLISEVRSENLEELGKARRFAALLLLQWIRKRLGRVPRGTIASKEAQEALASVLESARKSLQDGSLSDAYVCEVILLLGTLCTVQSLSEDSKQECAKIINSELRERRNVIVRLGLSEALTGAGYAMITSCTWLPPILNSLLSLWTSTPDAHGVFERQQSNTEEMRSVVDLLGECQYPSLKHGLMLLHLLDYVGSTLQSNYRDHSRKISNSKMVLAVLMEGADATASTEMQCASVMAAVGFIRSINRTLQGLSKPNVNAPFATEWQKIAVDLEMVVGKVSEHSLLGPVRPFFQGTTARWSPQIQHISRCVSFAVSRCRGLAGHPYILRCLLQSLLKDALNLVPFYSAQLSEANVSSQTIVDQESSQQIGGENTFMFAVEHLQLHTNNLFFQEVGAIARAMCEQYRRCSQNTKRETEVIISEFAQALYQNHRLFLAIALQDENLQWPVTSKSLDKMLEASFLTVVIFFSEAVKEEKWVEEFTEPQAEEIAAQILSSLSCMEIFRRFQLKEYSTIVQKSVLLVSVSQRASSLLAASLPSYEVITSLSGNSTYKGAYHWSLDEVQTARMLFYLRVLPVCVAKIPESEFESVIAPIMFLYMQHPLQVVTKACHALFAAFLSAASFKVEEKLISSSSLENCRSVAPEASLEEQLAVYYVRRALEMFPGTTPFQGLVSGVGALARHLPSGSPATVQCIHSLVERARVLYITAYNVSQPTEAIDQQSSSGSSLQKESNSRADQLEAAKRIQILLLHLILIVDLQVLPELLKDVAKLILGLPFSAQGTALAEAFEVVAGSDDFTRKPVVGPWLQSLSVLCSELKMKQGTAQYEIEYKNHAGRIADFDSGEGALLNRKASSEESTGNISALQTSSIDFSGQLGTIIMEHHTLPASFWDLRSNM